MKPKNSSLPRSRTCTMVLSYKENDHDDCEKIAFQDLFVNYVKDFMDIT